MSTFRMLSLSLAAALAAVFATVTSHSATAGPLAGVASINVAKGAAPAVKKVHYRKKYRKHRYSYRRGYKRRHRGYRHRRVVRAPFTRVETGRRVIVDAPFASVYVNRRHGVHVRAPFVNLWVPRGRRYGYRYY